VNTTLKILLVSGLILTAPLGCAPRRGPPVAPVPVALPKPPPPPPPAPPPKKVKLVLLPTERFLLPNVATSLDEKLGKAEVPGVDDRTLAAISMATAQGQAECVQVDDACYAKVAGLLGGDKLLWAEMERAGKAKKKGPIKVLVMLFDVEKGTVIGRADGTLKGDVADNSLDMLVGRAISGSGPTVPPPPPPPPPVTPPAPAQTVSSAAPAPALPLAAPAQPSIAPPPPAPPPVAPAQAVSPSPAPAAPAPLPAPTVGPSLPPPPPAPAAK